VFVRDGGGTWSQQAYLKSPTPQDDQRLTFAAVCGDRVILSADNYDPSGAGDPSPDGAGFLFERNGSGLWAEVATFTRSNPLFVPLVGLNVALSEDFVILGTNTDPGGGVGVNPRPHDGNTFGAIYIFDLDFEPGYSVEAPVGNELTSGFDVLDFGTGVVGEVSAIQTVTITNTSGVTLNGLSVSVDGDAADDVLIDTSNLGSSLAIGASGTFDVRLCHTIEGPRWATIKISSDEVPEDPFLVSVLGEGIIGVPIEIISTALNGNTFTIWFTGDPAISKWTFSGFEDLSGLPEDKTSLTTLQELSPGSYQAEIDVTGEASPYFLQVSR
jgi:hypothetical protein